MQRYRADLHIHSVLSPCGDLEMSPVRIVKEAKIKNLDIIGITDHNSTLHAKLVKKLAKENGITVMMGAEVTSREEIHCLTFFEKDSELDEFQTYLEQHLKGVKNNPKYFGYQVVVDENDQILQEIETLLISALDVSIDELQKKVHELKGLFIPAHVKRPRFSLTSQLGFIPADMKADAYEISRHVTYEEFRSQNSYLSDFSVIRSSDAHFPEDIGTVFTEFEMEAPTFSELKKAIQGKDNRKVILK